MKKYKTPQIEVLLIENNLSMMASSAQCAFSYFDRNQANEIRSLSEHMYATISHRQKKALMAIMSNFALKAGNSHDIIKAFEFYIISIGFTEEELLSSSQGNRQFDSLEEILAVIKTIPDRHVIDTMIIAAFGFVRKANSEEALDLMGYVCETLGYTEHELDKLITKNSELMKINFG